MTSTDRISGIQSSLSLKAPCRAVSTANLTLSGEQTVNGVALVAGDRVLVNAQTTTSENGIYVVDSTAWDRAADFDGTRDCIQGTAVPVVSASAYAIYFLTTANPVIGTTALAFTVATPLSASAFMQAVLDDANAAAALTSLGFYAAMQDQSGVAFTTAGTSSAFTGTATGFTAYAENQEFDVEFHTASSGTPSLNISAVAAKSLKYRDPTGTLVSVGALIPSGWRSKVVYDGTDLIVREMPTVYVPAMGQCRLTKSGSNLQLARFRGQWLTINGANYSVPSTPITLAPTSNTANTLYYIYAYMNSGTMTLEYSATTHTTHSDGTEIKNGDATRAFVGIWRSGTSGSDWSSIATEGRSWFNRGTITATIKKSGGNLSCTSTSLAEVSSSFRGGFVCFADDAVAITLSSTVGVSVANSTYSNMSLYVDGVDWAAPPSIQQDYDTTSASYDRRTFGVDYLAEGHHTAQLWALTTAAHTFTLLGSDFTRYHIEVQG